MTDLSTVEGILHAAYALLSGPVGQRRNWEQYRTLFVPGARLMPVVSTGGPPRVRVLTVDDYIQRVEPIFAKEDFWEVETSREVETLGRIAHVLSHYESRRTADGPPFESGTNSMQLFFDDRRWWIVSVMWNTSRTA